MGKIEQLQYLQQTYINLSRPQKTLRELYDNDYKMVVKDSELEYKKIITDLKKFNFPCVVWLDPQDRIIRLVVKNKVEIYFYDSDNYMLGEEKLFIDTDTKRENLALYREYHYREHLGKKSLLHFEVKHYNKQRDLIKTERVEFDLNGKPLI